MPQAAPQSVTDLAEARAAARRTRDWATADRLRADIEAAGWKVIDAGTLYTLERAAPPDVVENGITRYGSSRSVPSRLHDVPVGLATVVMVVGGRSVALAAAVRMLAGHAPDGTQLVIVANGPSDEDAGVIRELDAIDPGAPGIVTEVVWLSERLGSAAARNAGIRRAAAETVILLDPAVQLRGDLVSPLEAALRDPAVAVAGPFGLVSADMRRFRDAPPDQSDVDAIRGAVLAFRRSDYVARGPLDEHFVVEDALDIWWSLVLRDGSGDDGPEDPGSQARLRRALRVGGLPVGAPGDDAGDRDPDVPPVRQAKRNWYRVLKRFATRRDLLVGG